ncbi:hypothetical protein BV22DRAFT_1035535 [Leucogyrophana mollusca]|uniref:Uncharacterized protein n=1 Tax=Leucogyrophana mollusca TaxID=85980 RepID=A0ACB8BFH3_9AGAM|nr:hypothetical protein BV22DRAFT_1035535 [Leucogyrophana mollusca]
MHSVVFAEMLSRSLSSQASCYDEVPVVSLEDDASEIRTLLHAFYHPIPPVSRFTRIMVSTRPQLF